MIEKVFKVGDTITIKRTSQAGTGYRYALVRLTGGVALVEELSEDADTPGGTSVQSFIFRFLQPGQVEIQFAYYRDSEEVLYEDIFSYGVVTSEKANPIIGGFGEFRPLTDQEKEIRLISAKRKKESKKEKKGKEKRKRDKGEKLCWDFMITR